MRAKPTAGAPTSRATVESPARSRSSRAASTSGPGVGTSNSRLNASRSTATVPASRGVALRTAGSAPGTESRSTRPTLARDLDADDVQHVPADQLEAEPLGDPQAAEVVGRGGPGRHPPAGQHRLAPGPRARGGQPAAAVLRFGHGAGVLVPHPLEERADDRGQPAADEGADGAAVRGQTTRSQTTRSGNAAARTGASSGGAARNPRTSGRSSSGSTASGSPRSR